MAKRNLKLKEKAPVETKATKAKAEVVAVKGKRAIDQGVVKHDIAGSYKGTSPTFVSRKSRTRIQIEAFGTLPDAHMTDRANAFLKDVKNKYGKSEFVRGNMDAGSIRRIGERGYLVHVSGDPASAQ